MRRLLQLGTFLFLLVTLLAPLAECLDRWDPPGISNDTEFAVFALVFALCLVLLVGRLVSALAQLIHLASFARLQPSEQQGLTQAGISTSIFVPPLRSSPLQI